uniref:pectinesterase n=1 Tax=Cunninghamia lanceolata TaxID=28977 RepID=A0A6G9W5D2_CUNLA|nr:pectin methylesterase 11 [Cunninghamia lanceolata]
MKTSVNNYGKIEKQGQDEIKPRRFGKKHYMFLGLLVFFLGVAIACLAVGLGKVLSKHNGASSVQSEAKAIESICSNTLYPETCVHSLSSFPGAINASGLKLVAISIRIGMEGINSAMQSVENFIQEQGDHTVSLALNDCVELLEYSLDGLDSSLTKLLQLNSDDISDLQTWLSSSLTYQSTCLDGLDDVEGLDYIMEQGKNVSMLLSNSLALIKNFPMLVGDSESPSHSRRLLSDEGNSPRLPRWVWETEQRFLLEEKSLVPDVVVALDGSGNYSRIQDAVDAAPQSNNQSYVIHIKAGVYEENVIISKKMTNIVFIGDGTKSTIISGSKNVQIGLSVYRSATVAVDGNGFIARDLSIENRSGPKKMQAVALRVSADQTAFYNCTFKGYEGTLYSHTFRQFYKECTIFGTVEFIFGNSAAIFQNCSLVALKPLPGQNNTCTAQAKSDPNQNTGFSFQKCKVDGTPELLSTGNFSTYLGTPLKQYSSTVFIHSHLSKVVHPAGWLTPNKDLLLDEVFMGEFQSEGPGSEVSERVNWSKQLSDKQASSFNADDFISASKWLPLTHIKFDEMP